MPMIGRPDTGTNPFKQIRKYDGPDRNIKVDQNKKEFDQRILEQVTGQKLGGKNVKFVDRKSHNQMGKNEFLKLLSFQLQNQDPLNPMKQDKFAGELAQFAQLEQMTQMNKSMNSMSESELPKSKFYAASLLGKKVVTDGTSVKIDNPGQPAELPFVLEKPAKKVVVRVLDQKGNMIAQLEKLNMNKGAQSIDWDGISMDGTKADKGDYQLSIFAWDESYQPIPVKTKSVGVVSSVAFENGQPILVVDGKKVALRDVSSFHLQTTQKPEKNNVENNMKQVTQ